MRHYEQDKITRMAPGRSLTVHETLVRDYPGWDAYNAALDAAKDRAERHRIMYEYSASDEYLEAQRRLRHR